MKPIPPRNKQLAIALLKKEWSVSRISRRLGIPPTTLQKWRKTEKLPGGKQGSTFNPLVRRSLAKMIMEGKKTGEIHKLMRVSKKTIKKFRRRLKPGSPSTGFVKRVTQEQRIQWLKSEMKNRTPVELVQKILELEREIEQIHQSLAAHGKTSQTQTVGLFNQLGELRLRREVAYELLPVDIQEKLDEQQRPQWITGGYENLMSRIFPGKYFPKTKKNPREPID